MKTTFCALCGTAKIELTEPQFSEGLLFELISGYEEYRVSGIGSCSDVNIIVPEEYEGLPVTEIGEKAFYSSSTLVSVKLPDTIKKIGDKAFSKCEKLEEVKMSDEVELGLDVFRESIGVIIGLEHTLEYVPAKVPTCYEAGNIAYYKCDKCDVYFEDEAGENRVYDIVLAPSHTFSEGYCVDCSISYYEVNIVSVIQPTHLGKFALGTLESAIGLPEYVTVYTEDGCEHTLPVQWDLSAYNKAVVGEYTIKGIIQTGLFCYSGEVTNEVSVQIEIVDYMEGTADIVFILDISGSMSDEIASVKNNLVALAQAIEAQGVSARWSVITYSDYTEYPTTPEEQTTIITNGTGEWFTSAEECATAINGIVLANGGDWEEVAVDGLMMANTLTTRQDARTFYILLTDADYKVDNNFGVESMTDAIEILNDKNINASVITSSECSSYYTALPETTGGIMVDIYTDFSQTLLDALIPIIYADVIA